MAPADAVDAVYTSDDSKPGFETSARQVFMRFKAPVMEPSGATRLTIAIFTRCALSLVFR